MNETAIIEGASTESEKPVQSDTNNIVQFPPFPDPTDDDFDNDISEEERNFYKATFSDLNSVKCSKLHCTACDKHIGCSTRNETRMRAHPMLRTLVCDSCHTFYNSGEFEKGDDGSELYCRWCGQGGQVYCCSDCPHVFCAKCIRRNFGTSKIREIEDADDWKCFKCNPNCLRVLRATCWALLRFCDLRNKIINNTEDPDLKEAYQKDCIVDTSECCKNKGRRKEKSEGGGRKRDSEVSARKIAANIISKIPATIQVKKFASINLDDSPLRDKKPRKRSASPKPKPIVMKNPIPIGSAPKLVSPISLPPLTKKMRMATQPIIPNLIKYNDNKPVTYTRIRPKMPLAQMTQMQQMPQMPIPIISNSFNGFNSPTLYNTLNNMVNSDNINLSLESLTQGLDMSTMAAITNNLRDDDDVVCTPDFPMEPLCEVTEDNDDDVQCITPAPAPKLQANPPPLVSRTGVTLPDLTTENIVQMTENDVTVNAQTGGLKFRVDPQTLSSNKMYRLPDGRIFAINANPSMPGGYSATIVAVTESAGKLAPKGATYAAKLSAVSSANTSTPIITKSNRNSGTKPGRATNPKRTVQKRTKAASGTGSPRECDLKVPVEWYRYNLIDAVDSLEYSLLRLNKLKKETTSMYLRTRSVGEMRSLHKTLDRLLNTSSTRFNEIKDNLNKGLKQYLAKKMGEDMSEDDDDVEILPNLHENDDPIFIDENSIDSNANDNQEVDLTGVASSEHNDSGENRNDSFSKVDENPLNIINQENITIRNDFHNSHFNSLVNDVSDTNDDDDKQHNFDEKSNEEKQDDNDESEQNREDKAKINDEVNKDNDPLNSSESNDDMDRDIQTKIKQEVNAVSNGSKENNVDIIHKTQDIRESNKKQEDYKEGNKKTAPSEEESNDKIALSEEDSNEKTAHSKEDNNENIAHKSNENTEHTVEGNDKKENNEKSNDKTHTADNENIVLNDKADSQDADDKIQDAEISEEMIETLLKDDVGGDDVDTSGCMEVPEVSENLT